jgi:hypothetical protein
MRRLWVVVFVAVLGVAVFQTIEAQVRTINPERLLADRFGFTPDEVSRARSGQAVAKLLPRNDASDVGVLAAVRINAQASRLVNWLRNVADFRKAAELGLSRRVSDQPQIGDFADVSLDADELAALRECRPGHCDLLVGDKAIARFQADVDWTSADAGRRANLTMRQLLLEYADAYLKGGDQALGAVHDEKNPRVRADEFHQVLWQSKELYDIAPALTAYLEGFPNARPPAADQFLYWGKGGVGSEASITLHQVIIYPAPGGEVFVVDKQLFATRYVDAGLVVISVALSPDGKGFYALAGARARSRMLAGTAARLLRGKVEKSTMETATMYLDWLRASMAM